MAIALPGIAVSRGYAVGRARVWHHGDAEVLEAVLPERFVEDEVSRYRRALTRAKRQLRTIRDSIPESTRDEIAEFFDAHLLMLDDSALAQTPVEIIRNRHCNAEWALHIQQEALVDVFDRMDDDYLKTRRDDVIHVVSRILRELRKEDGHREEFEPALEGPQVVFARDLLPEDLVMLHQMRISAVITEHGGPLSHTAILARSLSLPAVVGVSHATRYIREGEQLVVDGHNGSVLLAPESDAIAHFQQLQQQLQAHITSLERLRDASTTTRDGASITLRANIELPEDIELLKRNGAEGVGLYRTEFLYMNRTTPPTEEEQYLSYRHTIEALEGAALTIRTLDAAPDKAAGLLGNDGNNSALGLRAIRLCLKEPNLFRTQLRAIYRAAVHGPVRLLIPMITNLEEVEQSRQMIDEVLRQLAQEGIEHDPEIPVGAMIEVPSAAICADLLAAELDFLSIGTNDLIQYTLATDRLDETVNHLYNPLNPAVLRLIQGTISAAHRQQTPVALCGEMAGDPQLTRLLIGLGLREFSLPPTMLLEVKEIIRNSDARELNERITPLLQMSTPNKIRDALHNINHG